MFFVLYKYKLKTYIKPFFLDGKEHPAMHRNGQTLFLPHAKLKPKRENECRSLFVLHSHDLYAGKSKWIYYLYALSTT
ncbi:hypothetical protein CON65_21440 [Bacillus pseudomycoides]|uniref:Uncharacterized protein n=1 Tax=Bacillus pseudomycoides TaxID=64104 RepID=A0AA91V8U8_9BACI|nr:hypothetical protein COO03_17350 [Bacillus sp. AFS098217]PED80631.1 hypothetical protein CON65_21440 [Bacillus pseudomycoides]PEU16984.1 hypothetical protein CN524_02900 [Bacillus sp. AFS019443]PEU20938.1 hypothetical protein CN525_03280 [Bacillus sp. AFS014408]